MKCANTGQITEISRYLFDTHVKGATLQPRGGERPPDEYISWLQKTAALRAQTWPSDEFSNDLEEPFLLWHHYGMRPAGQPLDLEYLPRFRRIAYIGPPLNDDSEHDRDLMHLMMALYHNITGPLDFIAPSTVIRIQSDPGQGELLATATQQALFKMRMPGSGFLYVPLMINGQTEYEEGQKKMLADLRAIMAAKKASSG